jgi:hypothetical protein
MQIKSCKFIDFCPVEPAQYVEVRSINIKNKNNLRQNFSFVYQ